MATPKQIWKSNIHYWVIAVLMIIAVISYSTARSPDYVLSLATAVAIAGIIDSGVNYVKDGKLTVTTSSIISGLIIGLVMSGSYIVMALAATIAMLSKHMIKVNKKHIFNPANLGILVALLISPSLALGSADQAWAGGANIYATFVLGLLIAYRMRRVQMVFTFFLAKAAIISMLILAGILQQGTFNPEILSGTVFFFAFIMLIEPVTSPAGRKGRLAFPVIVVLAYFALYFSHPAFAIIGSLAIADLFVPGMNRLVK